jgi:hypothetical protein
MIHHGFNAIDKQAALFGQDHRRQSLAINFAAVVSTQKGQSRRPSSIG